LAIGLNRLSQGGVDLVLLDLDLPDSEGLETFTRIRADGHNVPLIVLSAGDSEPLALQMLQDGADRLPHQEHLHARPARKSSAICMVRRKQTANNAAEGSSGETHIIGVLVRRQRRSRHHYGRL